MLGRLIGNYRIVRELGGGAMGKVYYAEHALMGRRAAIKVIRDELSSDQDALQRFINEARLVSRIGHPNIVEITDFGQYESRYYIIMELLEGETLEIVCSATVSWTKSRPCSGPSTSPTPCARRTSSVSCTVI